MKVRTFIPYRYFPGIYIGGDLCGLCPRDGIEQGDLNSSLAEGARLAAALQEA
jgi:hypothetical protein